MTNVGLEKSLYIKRVVCPILAILLGSTFGLQAQEHHHPEPSGTEQLGAVSFPISCKPNMQSSFERGIALLHSFGYRAAEDQFEAIEKEDSGCAMAYWGDAMSLYRQLWDRPSQADLQKGHALIQKAQLAKAKTLRERKYIEAAAAYYTDDG